MQIKLIEKIKLDGRPCRKSANVIKNLKKLGLIDRINQIIAADERKQSSEGLVLALHYQVEAAPFFIVDNDDGSTYIYKTYSRFLKEVFNQEISESEEISEIMAQNPELDFI